MLGSCSVNAEHQELREDAAPQSPPLHVPPVLPGRAHALELRLCPIRVCIHTSAEQNNSNIGRGFVDGHKSGFVSVSRSKRLELRADSQEVVLDSFKACAAGRTPDLSEKASCQARRSGHWSHLTKLPGRASLWTPLSPSVSLLSCVCCLLESWTPPSNKSSLLPKESHIEVSFHRRACAYASMNSFRVVSPFSWTAPLENETCSSVQKTVQNNIRDWRVRLFIMRTLKWVRLKYLLRPPSCPPCPHLPPTADRRSRPAVSNFQVQEALGPARGHLMPVSTQFSTLSVFAPPPHCTKEKAHTHMLLK
ncbi:uncharacterized protein [Marmota flaviventris]|uniref:uncharacterized protein n=1 Tax=Marmota flaviventris TaxID=93162 RepID=UPI003A888BB2